MNNHQRRTAMRQRERGKSLPRFHSLRVAEITRIPGSIREMSILKDKQWKTLLDNAKINANNCTFSQVICQVRSLATLLELLSFISNHYARSLSCNQCFCFYGPGKAVPPSPPSFPLPCCEFPSWSQPEMAKIPDQPQKSTIELLARARSVVLMLTFARKNMLSFNDWKYILPQCSSHINP